MNLLDPMLEQVRARPQRLAIVDRHGMGLTYGELDDRSSRLAAAWRQRGLAPGMKVLIGIRPSIAFYVSMLAIWKAGAAAVFPEPFSGLAGFRQAAAELRPQAILSSGWPGLLFRVLPETWRMALRLSSDETSDIDAGHEAVEEDAPALYSFTGGTTGAPKCIERSHRFMLAQNQALHELMQGEREVDVVWFPVFVFACFAVGSTAVLPDSNPKRPDAVDTAALRNQIQSWSVTRLLAPPAVAIQLAEAGVKVDTVLTGGGPVFPQAMRVLQAMSRRAFAVYGSTEAEPIAVLDLAQVSEEDLQAMESGAGILAGVPVPQIRLDIVDDEILVSGRHVVETYTDVARNEGTKVLRDGITWHRTGDGGRLDAEGRLWLRGRLVGRVNGLWPFEVEAEARSWPGVTGAALGDAGKFSVLGISGDGDWSDRRYRAEALGIDFLVRLDELPVDRRHGSRIDYQRLRHLLAEAPAV